MPILNREGRGAWRFPRARRASDQAFRPDLLALETRELLSGISATPSNEEQYMLQLLNRARANPAVEGQRLAALVQTDPVLQNAARGWDLSGFLRQISSVSSEPPLAFNTRLIAAARDQDAVMLASNNQTHAPEGFLVTGAGGRLAGDGQPYYPVTQGSWSTGENVFAYSQNVNGSTLKSYVDYYHAGFLIDWGNPDYGHLKNYLAPGPSQAAAQGKLPYNEVGIGLLANATPTTPPPANPENPANAGLNVGPVLVTQEFAWHSGNAFLTGAVYRDLDGNSFYTPGEGLGGVSITAVGLHGEGTFGTQTWSSGGYSLALAPGTYAVTASGGGAETRTTVVTISSDNVGWDVMLGTAPADQPVPGDYDGDGKTEVAVYRASTAQWFILGSKAGAYSVSFGAPGVDIPVPADYDGDGKTDIAVYRPTTGQWFILGSRSGPIVRTLGAPGLDQPVPGDYDGDGKADIAVYRPSTAAWYIQRSSAGPLGVYFGQPGVDVPVPRDFDGDGKVDLAVYRPTTAQWFILGSRGGAWSGTFGEPGVDIPIPADYDGDHVADLALYRPTTAQWFVLGSHLGAWAGAFGQPGVDVPVPGDFDGDGKIDLAVFRPTNASWYIIRSRDGAGALAFGQSGIGGRPSSISTSPVTNYGDSSVPWAGAPASASTRGFIPPPSSSPLRLHPRQKASRRLSRRIDDFVTASLT